MEEINKGALKHVTNQCYIFLVKNILNVSQCLDLIYEKFFLHLSESPLIAALEHDISK